MLDLHQIMFLLAGGWALLLAPPLAYLIVYILKSISKDTPK